MSIDDHGLAVQAKAHGPMENKPRFERPSFEEANSVWTTLLKQRGFPADCLWVFEENLCFESNPANPGKYRLGIQTQFTPPPADAERIAYDYFSEFDHRLVFYRIGTVAGKSACTLLCDEWFENKGQEQGFVRRDDWMVSFRPGEDQPLEEVKEEAKWKDRIVRDRPLHDLDFCMTLRGIHEYLAHGRVLTSYEHYALRFLHLWKRVLKPSE